MMTIRKKHIKHCWRGLSSIILGFLLQFASAHSCPHWTCKGLPWGYLKNLVPARRLPLNHLIRHLCQLWRYRCLREFDFLSLLSFAAEPDAEPTATDWPASTHFNCCLLLLAWRQQPDAQRLSPLAYLPLGAVLAPLSLGHRPHFLLRSSPRAALSDLMSRRLFLLIALNFGLGGSNCTMYSSSNLGCLRNLYASWSPPKALGASPCFLHPLVLLCWQLRKIPWRRDFWWDFWRF